ncbi:hypothetical protein C8250_009390 [Streptomyces sp. So13.3]|uniref:hypothetical protein n=1 Tax=Streptomyces sp. So13.3 TaxID=2136173 RepID=UPI001106507A|nr:hypothetical protein [Streptomyces sp. So13.3]QNA72091.1 hypothetical protein C8250_009390 [Streptomyces sp. So13.3]
MNVELKSSSADERLTAAFGAPVTVLYATATGPDALPAVTRALELRSFLVIAEEQVACVRDRVHAAMAPGRDLAELSADDLRLEARWLEAALDARDGYRAALDELLHTMPAPDQRPVASASARRTPPAVTAHLPSRVAAPAPQRAGAGRHRRP